MSVCLLTVLRQIVEDAEYTALDSADVLLALHNSGQKCAQDSRCKVCADSEPYQLKLFLDELSNFTWTVEKSIDPFQKLEENEYMVDIRKRDFGQGVINYYFTCAKVDADLHEKMKSHADYVSSFLLSYS